MKKWFHTVCSALAGELDPDLMAQIQFLKVENEILCSHLKSKVMTTSEERQRLLRHGLPLGDAIRDLITIVRPKTFLRWAREVRGRVEDDERRRPGRPRIVQATRHLVIRIGREPRWGYTRIQREMLKLARKISRSTVKRILQEEGIPDATNRSDSTWHEFIDRHVESLWACDFGTQTILSVTGIRVAYFLFFIHVGSRRVYCTRSTKHPDSAWVTQQARNFCMRVQESGTAGTYMIHDRDNKFTKQFDRILLSEGLKHVKLPIRSPNLNAYCEAWLGSLKRECLNHFVVFGERHLDYLIQEYMAHYTYERPHQSLENTTIVPLPIVREGQVRCRARLSGLLRHYYRAAA